jgi:mannitol/fructose-specific phosphotransferase system IIA component (Ntr-type)
MFYTVETNEKHYYHLAANSKEEALEKFNQNLLTDTMITAEVIREETFDERLSRLTREDQEIIQD